MSTRDGGGISGISNYLTTILLPSITTLRLANIYDNELTSLGGFPAATVTVQEELGKVLDNTRNLRTYRFTVRIFIDRKSFGSNKAETILRNVADEITLKLDADLTLGGNCLYANPFPAKFGYIERENNDIRLMDIQLEVNEAITWR